MDDNEERMEQLGQVDQDEKTESNDSNEDEQTELSHLNEEDKKDEPNDLNEDKQDEPNDLNEDEQDEPNDLNEEDKKDVKVKSKNKTGVVYLTKIPPGRNYTRIREIFEKFAPIGNIYLVPDKQANNKLQKKGKTYKSYKEGFVEFKRKKDAKNFTTVFNGASLKSSGSNVADGFIWDIKYLHRVKWHHVMAKFKHNKAIEEQRLRLETEKAREEADHYLEMVNEWKKRGNREMASDKVDKIQESLTKKQKKTKDELLKAKKSKNKDKDDLNGLYETIFG